jgi:hypothetical protein
MYSPLLGQFAQRDPLGYAAGDENLYRYVGNSPEGLTDPSGLLWRPYKGIASEKYLWEAGVNDTFLGLVENLTKTNPSLSGLSPIKNQFLIVPWEPTDTDAPLPDAFNGNWADLKVEMKKAWGTTNEAKPAPCGIYDASRLFDTNKSGKIIVASIGTDQTGYITSASAFFQAQLKQNGMEYLTGEYRKLSPQSALAVYIGKQSRWGKTPIQTLIIIGHSWSKKNWIGGNQSPKVPGANQRFTLGNLVGPAVMNSEGITFAETTRDLVLGHSKHSSSGSAADTHPETFDNHLAFWTTYDNALQFKLSPIAWLAADAKVYYVGCKTNDFAIATAKDWLRGTKATAYGTLFPTWAVSERQMGWGDVENGKVVPMAGAPLFDNWQAYLNPPNGTITVKNGNQVQKVQVWKSNPGTQ